MLSDELATALKELGRLVIQTSIDGFHRPKAERYARGRYSAEGYFYDSRDLVAIKQFLLDPLGPVGNRVYRTASFDLERDRPMLADARIAPKNAILIVDGTFLQRHELRDRWDFTIFVEASPAVCEARGVTRDAAALGGMEAARALYTMRYRPAFEIYEQLCSPAETADALLLNEDIENPQLTLRSNA